MKMEFKNELVIEITQELVDEFNKYYKKTNPRTKKEAISSPLCPTLNKFTTMVRMAQNDSKQKYKKFMMYILEKNNIEKLMLEECEMCYIVTYPTLTRRDLDNAALNSKYYGDAMVEFGLLKDDSYFQIKSLSFMAKYEKTITKLEIVIKY